MFFLRARALENHVSAGENLQARSVLHLETFVVNLGDSGEKAYLRVGIDLGLSSELKMRDTNGALPVALARDAILGVLSLCRPDELMSREGKAKLKSELLRVLQARAPALGVEEIYFTEFLIQR